MLKDAVAQEPLADAGISEVRDPWTALREVVEREGAHPQGDRPELRHALGECAALARRRMQPPEQYLVRIKACVRQAGGAIEVSLIDAFMAQVVTLSIAEYYRSD